MKNFALIFFLLLFFQYTSAQECNCASNFRFMVEKVTKNYVGYADKITANNKVQFKAFTDSLFLVAKSADKYECASICQEWISFFKDKHMIVGMDPTGFSEDSIRNFYITDKKVKWTESSFKSYLDHNKGKLDDVEGIWYNSSKTYKVGIILNSKNQHKTYIGFILKADSVYWMPQQIKFEITKQAGGYKTSFFRLKDHSYTYPRLTKTLDTLNFESYGKWYKNPPKVISKQVINPKPEFTILDNQTAMFSLPSFGSLDYIKNMDTLIKNNEAILKTTKHLIIDLRNNSGGSVLVYEKLIPYIYTNPILTEGASVLATEDNIKEGYSKEYTQLSDSMQHHLKEKLIKLNAHKGELYNLYPVDTIKLDTPLSNPEQVSFIINRNTGSAAELFLLEAKQSKKVKLYGENTAGAVDYTEFIRSEMPCDFYVLYYPVCKSSRLPGYPLDNIGIKPDVEIPNSTGDWINFVKKDKL